MARRRKVKVGPEDGQILYKKMGGGSYTKGNIMIKPGQTFYAYPEEIPLAFKDILVAQESIPVKEPEPRVFELQETEEDGLFHIVDQDGKALTQKALAEDVAKVMLESL